MTTLFMILSVISFIVCVATITSGEIIVLHALLASILFFGVGAAFEDNTNKLIQKESNKTQQIKELNSQVLKINKQLAELQSIK
jgi:hypothetical protein